MPITVDKKQILSDPVKAYQSNGRSIEAPTLAQLASLAAERTELKQRRKACQAETKSLSREIGAAKKLGNPIDALKLSMKAHSERLKSITAEIAKTEAGILEIFQPEEVSRASLIQADATPLIRKRTYHGDHDTNINIRMDTDAIDTDAWNQYVLGNPSATTYHRADWLKLTTDTFGHLGYYFSARDNQGNITGVLPLIRLKSRLFGDFLVSIPYVNYGGAVADTVEIEAALIEAANALATQLDVEHVEYRDDIPRQGMPVRHDKVDMLLHLPPTVDQLWSQFSSKLRSQIRRAQREDPVVEIGGRECIDDFYQVFARNMRDLGTPVYSRSLFTNIVDRFPQESRIVIIKIDDRPVAAGFLIAHDKCLEIPWASTVRDFNHLSVNMILYWEVLKFAVEKGFEKFDFGRSSKDASTYRFKRQWGAQPEQLHWHYHLIREQTIPSITPHNAKYALLISTWKKLPIVFTRWLGPMIVRNIP